MARNFKLVYKKTELAGVLILAGGESRRMGKPKALLKLPSGQTLLDFHIEKAQSLDVPVYVADNGQSYHSAYSYQQVADFKKGQGPLAAIAGGMMAICDDSLRHNAQLNKQDAQTLAADTNDQKHVLVISCDSLIDADKLYAYLHEHDCLNRGGHDFDVEDTPRKQTGLESATISVCSVCHLRDDDHDYPLLGLYQLSLLAELQDCVAQKNLRVMRFIENRRLTVPMPKVWQSVANINTPEQFAEACKMLSSLK